MLRGVIGSRSWRRPELVEQAHLDIGVVKVVERGVGHDGTVFLLYERVVIGVVRPGAGHANVMSIAPGRDRRIEEFRAIVRWMWSMGYGNSFWISSIALATHLEA